MSRHFPLPSYQYNRGTHRVGLRRISAYCGCPVLPRSTRACTALSRGASTLHGSSQCAPSYNYGRLCGCSGRCTAPSWRQKNARATTPRPSGSHVHQSFLISRRACASCMRELSRLASDERSARGSEEWDMTRAGVTNDGSGWGDVSSFV